MILSWCFDSIALSPPRPAMAPGWRGRSAHGERIDTTALAGKGGKPERIMIDATHLKAHRTAASLLKKGLFPDVSGAPKAA
jgi:hypothetical protein